MLVIHLQFVYRLFHEMEGTTMVSNIVGYCDEYATDNYSAVLLEIPSQHDRISQ